LIGARPSAKGCASVPGQRSAQGLTVSLVSGGGKHDMRGPHIPLLRSIAPLAATSDAWISDVWGVLHDGVRPYPAASAACRAFRATGGTIVLVSNAPSTGEEVAAHLDAMGIPRGAFDAIVTSGDVTRRLIASWAGRPVHHLGPDRYLGTFAGLDVKFAPIAEAAVVVCTGLIEDEVETPDDYRGLLADMRRRDIPMICVNPDIVVERGDRLIYCAGALAEAYAALGGDVAYAGKPHPPIYVRARELIAAARGASVEAARILAIGDGIKTDIAGAAAAGLRAVFIASALHVGGHEALDEGLLTRLFAAHTAPPIAALQGLVKIAALAKWIDVAAQITHMEGVVPRARQALCCFAITPGMGSGEAYSVLSGTFFE
jgi:HAD superfamily hydrolase (TIGR01459 family)